MATARARHILVESEKICLELKQEIEETNKIKQEAEFSKSSGGNFARAIYSGRHGHNH